MKIYFDLSTSARWSGHAVGIVRVERELARRLPKFLGDAGGYCIYVPHENGLRLLPDHTAQEIIAGKIRIEFNQSTAALLSQQPTSLRRRVRNAILARPRLYQLIQRLRGLSFSLDQIEEVRLSENRERQTPTQPNIISVDEAAPHHLALTPETLIVSAGLDWEYKNLRGLHRMKVAHGFRYASVVYDLIPINFPHFVVPSYVNLLRDYFGELFWISDYCMSISAQTHLDMLSYCADFGIPPPLADYFPLGGDLLAPMDEKAVLPEVLRGKRYAIFVSTIEPRKNHRTLYQAWERAIRQGLIDANTCRLVFVGMGGWNTGDLRSEMAANPVTKETIVTLSGISDADLRTLYEGAEFSLFPSYYEGYGLPVAESLSYGTPCISSNAGSLPEIAGDLITYCDPNDPKAWMDAIVEAFAKPEVMRKQAAIISERFRLPTWDDAAETFFSKLKGLFEGGLV